MLQEWQSPSKYAKYSEKNGGCDLQRVFVTCVPVRGMQHAHIDFLLFTVCAQSQHLQNVTFINSFSAAQARTFLTWNRISGKLRRFSDLAIGNTSWISVGILLKWQRHFLGSVAQLRYGALQWTSTCPGLLSWVHNKVMVAALFRQCQAKQSVLAVTRKSHWYNDHCRLSWCTRFDHRIAYVCCDKFFKWSAEECACNS